MAEPVRVAVLISGRGSNMLALSEHKRRDPERAYRIVLVASNVPDARGLVLAKRLGIPIWAHSHEGMKRAAFDALLDAQLRAHDVEIVALAGYMRVLTAPFVDKWLGRMINIHPALLPSFTGLDTHRRALDAGVRIHGCSVHFVTAQVDNGPIIAQAAVPVLAGDSEQTLAARVLKAEHQLYPLALRLVAEGRARIVTGRTVFDLAGASERASSALVAPDLRPLAENLEDLARFTP